MLNNFLRINYIELVWEKVEKWYAKAAVFTPNLIVGILFFLLIYFSSRAITRYLDKIVRKKLPSKGELIPGILGLIRFLVILMGAFIALEIMGLSGFLWKFIGSLGVAGVIAGVALKDLASSMFSGMLVGVDKSFRAGDIITIGSNTGTVQEIGLLTTKILTEDGKMVFIPNQTIFSAPFTNISASPQRKVILEFSIPASENIQKTQEIIRDELSNIKEADLSTGGSEVIFTDLKDGNFSVQAKFWLTHDGNYLKAKSDAIMRISRRLHEENISLVSPQTITIDRKDSTP